MKILIDADGCPVVDITIMIAKQFNKECIILCDTSHVFEREGIETIMVPKGTDSVDFVLINMVQTADIVITQDYGLAAMALARKAIVINQNGMVYNDDNIEMLLSQRHTAKKIRMSGGRLKGSSKRIRQQDEDFKNRLINILES